MATDRKNKILIIGGTGYIGSYMVKASIKLGYPTSVYSRSSSSKSELLTEFHSLGATIIKGDLDEHEKLVSVIKGVDVVISVLASPQALDQLKIIEAIKVAGNVKRFVPSEFGCEAESVNLLLPPFQELANKKKMIRKAIEEAGIPYTFMCSHCCGAYFVNLLLHPHDQQREDIVIYDSGETKFVLNYEEDIALFTVEVANDPRACNKIVMYEPSSNTISQLELVSLWEKKTGRKFKKVHVSEEEIVILAMTLPTPHNIPMAILHGIFVKGVITNIDLGKKHLEASTLCPDLRFHTVEDLLEIFLKNPPKPVTATFG